MTHSRLFALALTLLLSLASLQAEAKRLGAGKSFGRQSPSVTQREAAKPAPTDPAPAAQKQAPAAATPATAPAAAQAQGRPWGGMLGGLAAGLGLAWLAHSLGFGEAFGQVLMFALLGLLGVAIFGYFMRSRANPNPNPNQPRNPYAFQGAMADHAAHPATTAQYKAENVGNDASARPWENTAHFQPSAAPPRASVRIGSHLLGGSQNSSIPSDFDVAGFIDAAKANFIYLQKAWDAADLPALRALMTDEMTAEIDQQLAQRAAQSGATGNDHPNTTAVEVLQARLLGVEDVSTHHLASVEFSGLISEDPSVGPTPFREVWNMTRSKTGTDGWLVAGVQALQ